MAASPIIPRVGSCRLLANRKGGKRQWQKLIAKTKSAAEAHLSTCQVRALARDAARQKLA